MDFGFCADDLDGMNALLAPAAQPSPARSVLGDRNADERPLAKPAPAPAPLRQRPGFAAPPPAPAPEAPVEEWRTEGSDLLGVQLSRTVNDGGAACRAVVVSWLSASESDFVDADGRPAALYKIRYLDGDLAGDHEDLEAYEVEESRNAPSPRAAGALRMAAGRASLGARGTSGVIRRRSLIGAELVRDDDTKGIVTGYESDGNIHRLELQDQSTVQVDLTKVTCWSVPEESGGGGGDEVAYKPPKRRELDDDETKPERQLAPAPRLIDQPVVGGRIQFKMLDARPGEEPQSGVVLEVFPQTGKLRVKFDETVGDLLSGDGQGTERKFTLTKVAKAWRFAAPTQSLVKAKVPKKKKSAKSAAKKPAKKPAAKPATKAAPKVAGGAAAKRAAAAQAKADKEAKEAEDLKTYEAARDRLRKEGPEPVTNKCGAVAYTKAEMISKVDARVYGGNTDAAKGTEWLDGMRENDTFWVEVNRRCRQNLRRKGDPGLGVGARVELDGTAGEVVENRENGWWIVRLDGRPAPCALRSARCHQLTVLATEGQAAAKKGIKKKGATLAGGVKQPSKKSRTA